MRYFSFTRKGLGCITVAIRKVKTEIPDSYIPGGVPMHALCPQVRRTTTWLTCLLSLLLVCLTFCFLSSSGGSSAGALTPGTLPLVTLPLGLPLSPRRRIPGMALREMSLSAKTIPRPSTLGLALARRQTGSTIWMYSSKPARWDRSGYIWEGR